MSLRHKLSQHYLEHLKNSKNVIEELPQIIDLLVLDGGEYTTYPEYKKLKDRSNIIALDDTAILKCGMARNAEGLKQAIADAEAVRQTAIENAKLSLEETFTPQIKTMLERKLRAEAEGMDDAKYKSLFRRSYCFYFCCIKRIKKN